MYSMLGLPNITSKRSTYRTDRTLIEKATQTPGSGSDHNPRYVEAQDHQEASANYYYRKGRMVINQKTLNR